MMSKLATMHTTGNTTKNKVDKTKRAEQFSAYYLKNKEKLSAERKVKRDLKKQALKTTTDVVAVALHV